MAKHADMRTVQMTAVRAGDPILLPVAEGVGYGAEHAPSDGLYLRIADQAFFVAREAVERELAMLDIVAEASDSTTGTEDV